MVLSQVLRLPQLVAHYCLELWDGTPWLLTGRGDVLLMIVLQQAPVRPSRLLETLASPASR